MIRQPGNFSESVKDVRRQLTSWGNGLAGLSRRLPKALADGPGTYLRRFLSGPACQAMVRRVPEALVGEESLRSGPWCFSADAAYRNAVQNFDKNTARSEHDAPLQRVMIDQSDNLAELLNHPATTRRSRNGRAVPISAGPVNLAATQPVIHPVRSMGEPMPFDCPLCRHGQTVFFHRDVLRPYRQCRRCALVFVPPAYRLSPAAEKAHYDQHDNGPEDPGYRRFLSRLFAPMSARVHAPARGLDFGSGPGPTLSRMFAEAGYDMAIYDPWEQRGRFWEQRGRFCFSDLRSFLAACSAFGAGKKG
jgi:hypothetical protein